MIKITILFCNNVNLNLVKICKEIFNKIINKIVNKIVIIIIQLNRLSNHKSVRVNRIQEILVSYFHILKNMSTFDSNLYI